MAVTSGLHRRKDKREKSRRRSTSLEPAANSSRTQCRVHCSRRNSRSAEKEGRKENAGGRISVASLWMRRPGALVPAAAVACCAAVCKWWQDREACTEVVAGLCRAPFGLVPLNYRFAPPLHVQPCILCTRWPVYCASPALLPASKKADFGAPACDRATAGGKQASHAARAPAKQAG